MVGATSGEHAHNASARSTGVAHANGCPLRRSRVDELVWCGESYLAVCGAVGRQPRGCRGAPLLPNSSRLVMNQVHEMELRVRLVNRDGAVEARFVHLCAEQEACRVLEGLTQSALLGQAGRSFRKLS